MNTEPLNNQDQQDDFDHYYKMLEHYQNEFLFRFEWNEKLRFRYLISVLIVESIPCLNSFLGIEFSVPFTSLSKWYQLAFPIFGMILSLFFFGVLMIQEDNRFEKVNISRMHVYVKGLGDKYNFTGYKDFFDKDENGEYTTYNGKYHGVFKKYDKLYMLLGLLWGCVMIAIILS